MLQSRLKATGEVQIFTTPDYTTKTDKLLRGDILLATGKHVAVVVKDEFHKKTIEEVANDVLRGVYGNEPLRSQRIKAEGYDYEAVKKLVNQKMNKTESIKKEVSVEDRPIYMELSFRTYPESLWSCWIDGKSKR